MKHQFNVIRRFRFGVGVQQFPKATNFILWVGWRESRLIVTEWRDPLLEAAQGIGSVALGLGLLALMVRLIGGGQ